MLMSEELTARLIAMVSEMSDAVHKTQQDVVVLYEPIRYYYDNCWRNKCSLPKIH